MIHLFYLKTFTDTAHTGSLRVAAQKNFVTQPAVSQHIRILEDKLRCRLFERQHKRVSLTPAGKVFLSYAEGILTQYQEAKTRMDELSGHALPELKLATVYSVGLYRLQPLVKRYLRRFPQIDVHLEFQTSAQIYDRVGRFEIDFGFVAYPEPMGGISSEVFAEERLIAVQSSRRRHLPAKGLHLGALTGTKLLTLSSDSPTRKAIDEYLKQHACHPRLAGEYDNIETLKSAVLLGIGFALLPESSVIRELKEGSLEKIPVKDLDLTRTLAVIYAKTKTFTKPARTFLDLVLRKKAAGAV